MWQYTKNCFTNLFTHSSYNLCLSYKQKGELGKKREILSFIALSNIHSWSLFNKKNFELLFDCYFHMQFSNFSNVNTLISSFFAGRTFLNLVQLKKYEATICVYTVQYNVRKFSSLWLPAITWCKSRKHSAVFWIWCTFSGKIISFLEVHKLCCELSGSFQNKFQHCKLQLSICN